MSSGAECFMPCTTRWPTALIDVKTACASSQLQQNFGRGAVIMSHESARDPPLTVRLGYHQIRAPHADPIDLPS